MKYLIQNIKNPISLTWFQRNNDSRFGVYEDCCYEIVQNEFVVFCNIYVKIHEDVNKGGYWNPPTYIETDFYIEINDIEVWDFDNNKINLPKNQISELKESIKKHLRYE